MPELIKFHPMEMHKNCSRNSGPKSASGAILLLVLGLLMLLSFLVSLFLKNLMGDMLLRSQLLGNAELKHYAYNGLGVVEATLNEILARKGNLFNPMQRWDRVWALAGLTLPEFIQLQVELEDESGKIPLNNPDQRQLLSLFGCFGDYLDAQELTQAYLQWLRRSPSELTLVDPEPERAKSTQPINGKQAQQPPQNRNGEQQVAPEEKSVARWRLPTQLNSYGQLAEIEAFRKRFFGKDDRESEPLRQLKSLTTLWATGPVNINAASANVLKCLSKTCAIDFDQVSNFLGRGENSKEKEGKHYYTSLQEINRRGHGYLPLGPTKPKQVSSAKPERAVSTNLETLLRERVGVCSRMVRIRIRAIKADVSFMLTALAKVESGSGPQQAPQEISKTALTNAEENNYTTGECRGREKTKKGRVLGDKSNQVIRFVVVKEGSLED
jgi:hypothetical protein